MSEPAAKRPRSQKQTAVAAAGQSAKAAAKAVAAAAPSLPPPPPAPPVPATAAAIASETVLASGTLQLPGEFHVGRGKAKKVLELAAMNSTQLKQRAAALKRRAKIVQEEAPGADISTINAQIEALRRLAGERTAGKVAKPRDMRQRVFEIHSEAMPQVVKVHGFSPQRAAKEWYRRLTPDLRSQLGAHSFALVEQTEGRKSFGRLYTGKAERRELPSPQVLKKNGQERTITHRNIVKVLSAKKQLTKEDLASGGEVELTV